VVLCPNDPLCSEWSVAFGKECMGGAVQARSPWASSSQALDLGWEVEQERSDKGREQMIPLHARLPTQNPPAGPTSAGVRRVGS